MIRRLTTADIPSLESFECAVYREPWTQDVQTMIREYLPREVTIGRVRSLGTWDKDKLIAVAAWSEQQPQVWRNHVLAVAVGHHRRGHGLELKKAVLAEARLNGCLLVISLVHFDNVGIIRINEILGARIEHDPDDPRRNTLICTIAI